MAFGVLAFSAIFLQKLGVPVPGAGGSLSLDTLIGWGVLLWALARRAATIDLTRILLLVVVVCCVILSLLLEQGIYSLPAMLLFLLAYSMAVIRVEMDEALMLRCFIKYQKYMVFIAWVVIGQQIVQFTLGPQYWPNLNEILPKSFLLGGYVYMRPYAWPPQYFMPNAIFFLEPSSLSLFLAVAVVVEISYFQNIKRLAIYGAAILVAMTGTAFALLAVLSPWLFLKMGPRLRKIVLLILPLFVLAAGAGAFSYLTSRTKEFSENGSSANERFIMPLERVATVFSDPSYLLSGNGPGSSPKRAVEWPLDKLGYEYGILTALAFHVFLLSSVLGTARNRTLAVAAALPSLCFGGGFALGSDVLIMIMFGSLLHVPPRREMQAMRYSPGLTA